MNELKEKYLLLKLKKIVYKQVKDMSYYESTDHILDRNTIIDEYVDIDGEEVKHNMYITYYLNGYITYDEVYRTIKSLKPFGICINEYDLEYAKKKARKII